MRCEGCSLQENGNFRLAVLVTIKILHENAIVGPTAR